MARPKKESKYVYKNFIGVKINDQQLENLKNFSQSVGLSYSEYIRMLLDERIPQINITVSDDPTEIKKLVHDLGKIGSNLNQIAKYFNTGGIRSIVMEDEIHECIIQLFEMREQIMKWGGKHNGNHKTYRK